MIHLPVFPFRTPEAFYEQLLASKPDPNSGQPDPAKMQAFAAHHPETVEALKVIRSQPASSGFDNSTFHGLNAFRFINAAGESTSVRWILTPAQPSKTADTASPSPDKDFLFDTLIAEIHRRPLQWYLIVIVGQPGDPTNDATRAWPAGREQVNVGTLTLDKWRAMTPVPGGTSTSIPWCYPWASCPRMTRSSRPVASLLTVIHPAGRREETAQPITPARVEQGE